MEVEAGTETDMEAVAVAAAHSSVEAISEGAMEEATVVVATRDLTVTINFKSTKC